MTEAQQRHFIASRILARVSGKGERRDEALRAVLDVTMPDLGDEAVAGVAAMIPELPVSLYQKWIGMFVDRIMETAHPLQLKDLCSGTAASDASLLLVYVMFMESERMEKVVADDLRSLADAPEAAAAWLSLHAGDSTKQ